MALFDGLSSKLQDLQNKAMSVLDQFGDGENANSGGGDLAGYEEIDFYDFILRTENGGLEDGQKFKSKALFGFLDGTSMNFDCIGGEGNYSFTVKKRHPAMEAEQEVTIYYSLVQPDPDYEILKAYLDEVEIPAPSGSIVCENCGKKIPEGAKFCMGCGTPVPVQNLFCPNCGTKAENGAQFCGSCGTQFDAQS